MKKITKTAINEYDKDGKLLKKTETIVEEESYDTIPSCHYPLQPLPPWTPGHTISYL